MIPRYAALWTLCAVLAGCASLGFVTPETLEERIAAAVTTNTAFRTAATNSLAAHALSSDDADYALAQTRENRKLLNAARVVAGQGDTHTAEGRLVLVLGSLRALRTYLADQGVNVPEVP